MEENQENQILGLYETVGNILSTDDVDRLKADIITTYEKEKAVQPTLNEQIKTETQPKSEVPDDVISIHLATEPPDFSKSATEQFDEKYGDISKPEPHKKLKIKSIAQIDTPQKETLPAKLSRHHYNHKAQKATSVVTSAKKQLENVKTEKQNKEDNLRDILSEIDSIKAKITGLENANAYAEMDSDGDILSKFLKIAIYSNNRQILQLQKQSAELLLQGRRVRNRITEIEANIVFLEKNVIKKQGKLADITAKIENIGKVNAFANPFTALILNAKSSLAMPDLEQYFYRRITDEQVKYVETLSPEPLVKRGIHSIIVRFLKTQLSEFCSLLGIENNNTEVN
jgi:hypothetical protein